jgi:glycosyltransferase involved in cell wall biosynthesis
MRKKIVFLHTDFRLYWKQRLNILGKYLKEKNAELIIIEISGKGSPYKFEKNHAYDIGVTWFQLFPYEAMEEINPKTAVKSVLRKLDNINPDIVFAGSIAFPSGASAIRWCDKNKKHIVLFDDARLEDVPRAWYINWVKHQLYALVDAMIIPAQSHVYTYIYYGFKHEQLFYGINCIDNKYFSDLSLKYKSHDSPHNVPYILAVGRQIPKKNWIRLIEAYKTVLIENRSTNYHLIFIGNGTEHSKLIEAAGDEYKKTIHFIQFISQNELAKYYSHTKALILPSLYGETWGLVVNEAMASGLPVLVSEKCGCSKTLLEDGVNGYLFNPENNDSIKEAIISLISMSEQEWQEMGKASKVLIKEWDIDRFCQAVYNATEYVITKKNKNFSLPGKVISRFWNGKYNPS